MRTRSGARSHKKKVADDIKDWPGVFGDATVIPVSAKDLKGTIWEGCDKPAEFKKPMTDKDAVHTLKSGAKRSHEAVRFDLIPSAGLSRIAGRFALGAARYGADGWRACLSSRENAKEFAAEAYNHMMEHVMHMNTHPLPEYEGGPNPEEWDDDLGAIGWAVTVLAEIERHFEMPWKNL